MFFVLDILDMTLKLIHIYISHMYVYINTQINKRKRINTQNSAYIKN